MKKTLTIILALLTLGTFAQNKKINTEKSTIEWVGKKVTGKHNGTINFKDGAIVIKKNKVTGGKFIVDMTSINTTDLSGDYKTKLDNHLKDNDFFGVEEHPTATLTFKKIANKGNKYTVTADLTIKDITHPVTFDMVVNKNSAKADLVVDRTKYDIKYGSGSFFDNLGDKTINDNFELSVNIVF